MNYALNIQSGLLKNNFRLQTDNQWLRCGNPEIINSNHYTSANSIDIINLQVKNIQIDIEEVKFDIEPEDISGFINENELYYSVYGFRKDYPKPPDENQLLQLLINGDDTTRNYLILKTDSLFYLQNKIEDNFVNPEYVVQFKAFQKDNGYVGSNVNREYARKNFIKNQFIIGKNT